MSAKMNFKISVLFIGALIILFQPTLSYARDDHGGRFDRRDHFYRYQDHPRFGVSIDLISNDYVPVVAGGASYYYYDGLYYTPAGNAYVLVTPPVGAIVTAIPIDYRPVNINGVIYYTDSGIFYVRTRYGYQVVPPPVVQTISGPVLVTQTALVPEPQNQTKVAEGAGLGGILGALFGGIIGHQQKGHHELGGALIGGAAGAAAGGIVGAQIPNQNVSTPVAVAQPSPVIVTPPPAVESLPAVVQAPSAPQPAAATAQGSSDGSITINIPNGQGGYTPVIIKRSGSGYVGPQGEYYPEFPKVSQLQTMYSK
jgi:uncharacterized protein YcfJ